MKVVEAVHLSMIKVAVLVVEVSGFVAGALDLVQIHFSLTPFRIDSLLLASSNLMWPFLDRATIIAVILNPMPSFSPA